MVSISEQHDRSYRIDRGDFVTRSCYVMPSGALRADGIVTRAGVFKYLQSDGTIRYELRHPDDVFDATSLNSLGGIPVTNLHPSIEGKAVMVDPKNFDKFGVGVVGDEIDTSLNPFIKVPLNIQRQDGIDAIESGRVQLSLGYKCKVVPEVGVYDGMNYTHRQTKIKYNHLALVDEARAGDKATILGLQRLDSSDDVIDVALQLDSLPLKSSKTLLDTIRQQNIKDMKDLEPILGTVQSTDTLSTINIDGIDIPMSLTAKIAVNNRFRADAQTIGDLQKMVVKLQDEVNDSKVIVADMGDKAEEVEKATARNEILTAQVEQLKSDLKTAQTEIDNYKEQVNTKNDAIDSQSIRPYVQARVNLERSASVYIDDPGLSDMTDREIMEAVIAAQYGNRIDTAGKSDDFVKHSYETLLAIAPAKGVQNLRKDTSDTPPQPPKEERHKQHNDAADPIDNEGHWDSEDAIAQDIKRRQARVKNRLSGSLR